MNRKDDFPNNIGEVTATAAVTAAAAATKEELKCDYLVIGAGTAGMSFVDTILTENSKATVVLVDRNSRPGGHWTKAYPFVKLHQQSCNYGVNSRCLGKHLNKKGNEVFDVQDRATGFEIVEYYQLVCDTFEASGRVKGFFDAEYMFDEERRTHTITTVSNTNPVRVDVKCGKLVTVTSGIIVPSMRAPLIPVHESVSTNFVPINDIPSSVKSGKYSKYIVFGNGKTGVDAITNLIGEQKIDQSQITWVISRDVWYFNRQMMGDFFKMMSLLSKITSAKSVKESFLTLEEDGLLVRLDPARPYPEVFKGPTIDSDDLAAMRSIQNIVRMGRATSIERNTIVLDDGSIEFSPNDTLLVDCMVKSDGVFGYTFDENFKIFEPERINLGPPLALYNPSFSSALIAFLECAINNDDEKNDCCYFFRGKYCQPPDPKALIGYFYMAMKAQDALSKVKGGTEFILNSRTNDLAPMHHKGGMLGLMWKMRITSQLHKFPKDLFQKIESKGYEDVDHCFGIETFSGYAKQKEKQAKRSTGAATTTGWFSCFRCSRQNREETTTASK